MDGRLDCVIVGGGPGGLAAAVYLARFRRRFVLVDAGDSRASLIPLARNLAGFPEGITGRDLLARMRDQARRYGADLRDGRIDTLAMEDGGFRLAGGDLTLWARTVMLATGVKDNAPRLPERLDDAVRRGMIRICPICDGYEGAGERIGVLGSSAHAAAEALFLRTFSDRVSLILVSEDGVLPDDSRRSLDEAGVEVLVAPIETVTIEDDAVSALCLTDGGRTGSTASTRPSGSRRRAGWPNRRGGASTPRADCSSTNTSRPRSPASTRRGTWCAA